LATTLENGMALGFFWAVTFLLANQKWGIEAIFFINNWFV